MTPEIDKFYWVQFGYSLYLRRCLAVTNDGGGLFKIPFMGVVDRRPYDIKAVGRPTWLRKILS